MFGLRRIHDKLNFEGLVASHSVISGVSILRNIKNLRALDYILAMLDQTSFLIVVKNTPLISVDFLLMQGGEVLLGLRNNRPARNFWFVPGGRILKGETIKQAILRVAEKELGIAKMIENGQLKVTFYGTFEHFYDDCFVANSDTSTHYVVLGHKIELPADFVLPMVDEQHAEFKWWDIQTLLSSDSVHQYSKDYFLGEYSKI